MTDKSKPLFGGQEQRDLSKLLEDQKKIRLDNISFMEHCMGMNGDDFKHSGFKSLEDALVKSMQNMQRELKKVNDAFLKKYPD